MNRFLSVRRVALVVATLGVLGFTTPLFAEEYALEIKGKFEITTVGGDMRAGVIQGKSEPGGHFTGGFEFLLSEDGNHIDGIVCYVYPDGMWAALYVVDYDPVLDAFVGSAEIVYGDGVFDGATGGATGYVDRGSKGKFEFQGTISLPN
jgi:hypothetical protein